MKGRRVIRVAPEVLLGMLTTKGRFALEIVENHLPEDVHLVHVDVVSFAPNVHYVDLLLESSEWEPEVRPSIIPGPAVRRYAVAD